MLLMKNLSIIFFIILAGCKLKLGSSFLNSNGSEIDLLLKDLKDKNYVIAFDVDSTLIHWPQGSANYSGGKEETTPYAAEALRKVKEHMGQIFICSAHGNQEEQKRALLATFGDVLTENMLRAPYYFTTSWQSKEGCLKQFASGGKKVIFFDDNEKHRSEAQSAGAEFVKVEPTLSYNVFRDGLKRFSSSGDSNQNNQNGASSSITTDCRQNHVGLKKNSFCLIVNHENKILGGKLTYDGLKIDLSGGTYDAADGTGACTAKREVREETGLDVHVRELLLDNGKPIFHCVINGAIPAEVPSTAKHEISYFNWFSIDSVNDGEWRGGSDTKAAYNELMRKGGSVSSQQSSGQQRSLPTPPSTPQPQQHSSDKDACGCPANHGWSSTNVRCQPRPSVTDPREVSLCERNIKPTLHN